MKIMWKSPQLSYGILGLGIVCKKRCRITSISSFFFGNVIYDGCIDDL